MRYILTILISIALPCSAQEGAMPMWCAGSDPSWSMTLPPASSTPADMMPANTAHFDYLYDSELDFALATYAEGADWPRAYTFVGRGGSAILLVEEPDEDNLNTLAARVFTQRGETPVLLAGSCNLIHN